MKRILSIACFSLVAAASVAESSYEGVLSQGLTSFSDGVIKSNTELGAHWLSEHKRWQLGAVMDFNFDKPQNRTIDVDISMLAGVTINFTGGEQFDYANSFFIFGGVGPVYRTPGIVHFQGGAQVGKRFKITDSITYRPYVAGVFEGSQDNVFSISVLSMGISL